MFSQLLRRISTTQSASPKILTPAQLSEYREKGFLILRNSLPAYIKENLGRWTDELQQLPETAGKWMKYFEQDAKTGQRVLCRIENFLPYFQELREVTYGYIREVTSELFGQEAAVYKEKVNFKFPQGAGFNAHQDQPAFVSFGIKQLCTVLLPIDPNTRASGGLDMVDRVHKQKRIFEQNLDGSIRTDIEASLTWLPVDAEAGDIIFFDSYVPHRSDINTSNFTRRNLYLTYNPISEGFLRDRYYEEKRKYFPPDIERDPNVDYSEGAKVFNVANPIKQGQMLENWKKRRVQGKSTEIRRNSKLKEQSSVQIRKKTRVQAISRNRSNMNRILKNLKPKQLFYKIPEGKGLKRQGYSIMLPKIKKKKDFFQEEQNQITTPPEEEFSHQRSESPFSDLIEPEIERYLSDIETTNRGESFVKLPALEDQFHTPRLPKDKTPTRVRKSRLKLLIRKNKQAMKYQILDKAFLIKNY